MATSAPDISLVAGHAPLVSLVAGHAPLVSLVAGHGPLVSQMAASVPDLSQMDVSGPSFPGLPGSSMLEERSVRQKRGGWQESHMREGGRGVWRRRRKRRKRLVKGERDHWGGGKGLEPVYQDVPPEAGDGSALIVTVTCGQSPASYTVPILPGQPLKKSPGMVTRNIPLSFRAA